jgi:hypothetical protein
VAVAAAFLAALVAGCASPAPGPFVEGTGLVSVGSVASWDPSGAASTSGGVLVVDVDGDVAASREQVVAALGSAGFEGSTDGGCVPGSPCVWRSPSGQVSFVVSPGPAGGSRVEASVLEFGGRR